MPGALHFIRDNMQTVPYPMPPDQEGVACGTLRLPTHAPHRKFSKRLQGGGVKLSRSNGTEYVLTIRCFGMSFQNLHY